MTDGKCSPQYESNLRANAEALRGSGEDEDITQRHIWSIGVDAADKKELELISGDPNRVLHVDNFNRINLIKRVGRRLIVKSEYGCQ